MDYKEQIEKAKLVAAKWRENHKVFKFEELRIDWLIEYLAESITNLLSRAEAAEAAKDTLQNEMVEYKSRAEKLEKELASHDMAFVGECANLREKLIAAEELIASMTPENSGRIETVFGYPIDEVKKLIEEDRAKKAMFRVIKKSEGEQYHGAFYMNRFTKME